MNTSDWIALGAFLISVAALILTLHELRSNKPKLRLTVREDNILVPERSNAVVLTVRNVGRQPTTLRRLGVAADRLVQGGKSGSSVPKVLEFPEISELRGLPTVLSPGCEYECSIENHFCAHILRTFNAQRLWLYIDHSWVDEPTTMPLLRSTFELDNTA